MQLYIIAQSVSVNEAAFAYLYTNNYVKYIRCALRSARAVKYAFEEMQKVGSQTQKDKSDLQC